MMLQKLKQWLSPKDDLIAEKLCKAHITIHELTLIIEEQYETNVKHQKKIEELQNELKELRFYRSELYDLPEGAEVSE
jgi:hypothetical protein